MKLLLETQRFFRSNYSERERDKYYVYFDVAITS